MALKVVCDVCASDVIGDPPAMLKIELTDLRKESGDCWFGKFSKDAHVCSPSCARRALINFTNTLPREDA